MPLPPDIVDQVEAAYKATGLKPERGTWCNLAGASEGCGCGLGALIAIKIGSDRAAKLRYKENPFARAGEILGIAEDEARAFASGFDGIGQAISIIARIKPAAWQAGRDAAERMGLTSRE